MQKKKNIGFEIWRIIYPLIIYFGINIIVSFVFMIAQAVKIGLEGIVDPIVMTEILMERVMESALLITIISSVLSLLIIIPLYFLDKRKEKRIGEFIKYERTDIGKWILVAILGFSACVSLNILIGITGLAENSQGFDAVSKAIYGSSIFIQIIATVIMAPLCEEFLVRGLIYKRMARWTKPLVAALISSTLFGLIHMNIVQFVYAFIIGMMLALIYEKFQNIWAPILFHFTANATSIAIANIKELEKVFESDITSIIIFSITGITMIILIVYFIKTKKTNGILVSIEPSVDLGSQIEVQKKEKELYK